MTKIKNKDEYSVLYDMVEEYKDDMIDDITYFENLDIGALKNIDDIEYMPYDFKKEYIKFIDS